MPDIFGIGHSVGHGEATATAIQTMVGDGNATGSGSSTGIGWVDCVFGAGSSLGSGTSTGAGILTMVGEGSSLGSGSSTGTGTLVEPNVLRTERVFGLTKFVYTAAMNYADFGTYNRRVSFRIRQVGKDGMSGGTLVVSTPNTSTKATKPLLEEIVRFTIGSGVVATSVGGVHIIPWDGTIEEIKASLVTSTSSTVTVDVNTGTTAGSLASVVTSGNRPSIASPANHSVASQTTIQTPAVTKGMLMTVDVDVGGTDASGLVVEVRIRRKGGE